MAAVVAAANTNTRAAAESKGMPESTLRRWLDHPDMAYLRAKTRDELAEESLALSYLAKAEFVRKIMAHEVEPRDLIVAYGIAVDKAQLLSGHATSRTEHLELTNSLDDHERATLRDLIEGALAEPAEAPAGGDTG